MCPVRANITSANAPVAAVFKYMILVLLLPVFLERQLAIVLPQEVQEALVVALLHVEQARDDLVVAARFFQPLADHVADVAARDLTLHVERVDDVPERLAV